MDDVKLEISKTFNRSSDKPEVLLTATGNNIDTNIFVYQWVPGEGDSFRNVASVHDLEELPVDVRNSNESRTGFYRKDTFTLICDTFEELEHHINGIEQCVTDLLENHILSCNTVLDYVITTTVGSIECEYEVYTDDKQYDPSYRHSFPVAIKCNYIRTAYGMDTINYSPRIFKYVTSTDYPEAEMFCGVTQYHELNSTDLIRSDRIDLICRSDEDADVIKNDIINDIDVLLGEINYSYKFDRNKTYEVSGNETDFVNSDTVNSFNTHTILDLFNLPAGDLHTDNTTVVSVNDVNLTGWLDMSEYDSYTHTSTSAVKPLISDLNNEGYTPILFYNINQHMGVYNDINAGELSHFSVNGKRSDKVIYRDGFIFWCDSSTIDTLGDGYYIVDTPWGPRDPGISDYVNRNNPGTRTKTIQAIINNV